ncbi:hypothetical protein BGZ65_004434 [Modicella reniformis]|uniref:Uncharacterized protein n=1 Tax=Modicella reniformis TaxID=1440133 RepID=A0A9P6SPF2_9FUNG|nr:hypothetical protein BGZ65_004434 [Modicella reniformis]
MFEVATKNTGPVNLSYEDDSSGHLNVMTELQVSYKGGLTLTSLESDVCKWRGWEATYLVNLKPKRLIRQVGGTLPIKWQGHQGDDGITDRDLYLTEVGELVDEGYSNRELQSEEPHAV